jgi:hypothetical protein
LPRPKHIAYAITPGELEITEEDKPPQKITLEKGMAVIMPAQKHTATTLGKKKVKLVVVEIKGK